MDEKLNKEEQDQTSGKKKVYTPPTVTRYGKLTELTAAGSKGQPEGTATDNKNKARP